MSRTVYYDLNGNEIDPAVCDPIPQTNADRIRQMSDEELAKWMVTKTSCMRCPVALDACHNFEFSCGMSCEGILLSWLKAPVEEVDDG